MRRHMSLVAILLSIFLILPISAFADEGRIEIFSPTVITAPGSYILANNIYVTNQEIVIHSSNVKLDLNGFSIIYSGGSDLRDGIEIYPGAHNVEISNGTIRGFNRNGIFAAGAGTVSNVRLFNLRISENNRRGIDLESQDGFIIDSCFVSKNGTGGIRVGGKGLVINNVMADNTGYGLMANSNRLGFRSNIFYGNTGGNVSGNSSTLGENLFSD